MTRFTCFTSTKVQILTPDGAGRASLARTAVRAKGFTARFTCLTSTKVQILTPEGAGRASLARTTVCRTGEEPAGHVATREAAAPPCSTGQHTSAYVSIRQHTSAYVSIRKHTRGKQGHSPAAALALAL